MAAPASPPSPRRLTRAEYDRMGELGFFHGEHVELLHGRLVRTAPIGPRHASVVTLLNASFVRQLEGRAVVRTQLPLLAADDSEPEPDVAVVPPGRYAVRHPDRALLVIEVAESSLEYDRESKAPLYAASGVQEYWIVDVVGRAFEVRRGPRSGGYATTVRVAEGGTVSPEAFPDVVVGVGDVLP